MPSSFPTPEFSEEGFTLIVTATIKAGKMDEWLSYFYPAFEKVSEEPECLSFEVLRNKEQPNKVTWIETWTKSPEWFMKTQMTKPYKIPYEEGTKDLREGEREFVILERFGGPWARARDGLYQSSGAMEKAPNDGQV